jgi:lipoprotein signal peptidase
VTEPTPPLRILARLALLVAIGDWVTKAVAARVVAGEPVIFTERLRFAVVHNDGTAFGLSAGAYTWQINLALTVASILLMLPVARDLARIDTAAPRALGLILGGAVGNLASLAMAPAGVVDFIAVGFGPDSWLVFNVADLAAYVGLAMILRTGFLIAAEMRRTSRPGREAMVSHWVRRRRPAFLDREVVRPVPIADLVMTVNESEVVRPESVRRTEVIDLERAMADPKVIDIRPHLATQRSEVRAPRSDESPTASERAD